MKHTTRFLILAFASTLLYGCAPTPLIIPKNITGENGIKSYQRVAVFATNPRLKETDITVEKGDLVLVFKSGKVKIWSGESLDHHYDKLRISIGDQNKVYLMPYQSADVSLFESNISGKLSFIIKEWSKWQGRTYTYETRDYSWYTDNIGKFLLDIFVFDKQNKEKSVEYLKYIAKLNQDDVNYQSYFEGVKYLSLLEQLNSPGTVGKKTESLKAVKKMSLQEAGQVSANFHNQKFLPPPRTIRDITEILDSIKPDQKLIEERKRLVDSQPPENATNSDLNSFYYKRAQAAQDLGDISSAIRDYRRALSIPGPDNDYTRVTGLAILEFWMGNYGKCIELLKKEHKPGSLQQLAVIEYSHGNIKEAEKIKTKLEKIISNWGGNVWAVYYQSDLHAFSYEAKGQWRIAEEYRRREIDVLKVGKIKYMRPQIESTRRKYLAINLANQGRLVEAELEIRKALLGYLANSGKSGLHISQYIGNFAVILMKQGRYQEAEQLINSWERLTRNQRFNHNSLLYAYIKRLKAEALLGQGRLGPALNEYRAAIDSVKDLKDLPFALYGLHSKMYMTMIKSGELEYAKLYLEKAYEYMKSTHGLENELTNIYSGLYAAYNAHLRKYDLSLKLFKQSVPILMKQGDKDLLIEKTYILETYLRLLANPKMKSRLNSLGIDPIEESFRVAEVVRSQEIWKAVAESSTRMAISDPKMSDLARKEQNIRKQIDAFRIALSNHIGLPLEDQKQKVISDLRQTIKQLGQAQSILISEVKKNFPSYSELLNPSPPSITEIQNQLKDSEAFISIYMSEDRSYVWAIPKSGQVAFSEIPIGSHVIAQTVQNLRKALDTPVDKFGDIPKFDLASSYSLYKQILDPVKAGWKGNRHLIIASNGALTQIPFSIMTVRPVTLQKDSLLFANYRQVPWLIREASISNIPSATAFVRLRSVNSDNAGKLTFAGFGDPVFNLNQIDKVNKSTQSQYDLVAMKVRGIRLTSNSALDDKNLSSIRLEMLQRLPDTSGEIQDIGVVIGADSTSDIYLRERASESQVKNMDLTNRRILVFATHALVPGDLDGLTQPAIALSSPSVTKDKDDGLLTMEEIMGLKLNADWVVLSACNTASAEGKGAEAVSGLGRAFFYAGART